MAINVLNIKDVRTVDNMVMLKCSCKNSSLETDVRYFVEVVSESIKENDTLYTFENLLEDLYRVMSTAASSHIWFIIDILRELSVSIKSINYTSYMMTDGYVIISIETEDEQERYEKMLGINKEEE